jgi:hypothetical protein
VTHHWPAFNDEARRFYDGHLARPRKLFAAFTAKGSGSGRRAGPRLLYWQTVVAFSVAALEAGLEDVLFAAHGLRQGAEGHAVVSGTNSVGGNPRKWLVEDRLMAPSAQKIERVLFSDFGVILDQLPASAKFSARRKNWSKGGSGRGESVAGPADWASLRKYLDTLSHIRNATAHGDATKLEKCPTECEGLLWLKREDGIWSVQQPHALTALRTVLSAFNTAVDGVAARLGVSPPSTLTKPDTIDYPAAV